MLSYFSLLAHSAQDFWFWLISSSCAFLDTAPPHQWLALICAVSSAMCFPPGLHTCPMASILRTRTRRHMMRSRLPTFALGSSAFVHMASCWRSSMCCTVFAALASQCRQTVHRVAVPWVPTRALRHHCQAFGLVYREYLMNAGGRLCWMSRMSRILRLSSMNHLRRPRSQWCWIPLSPIRVLCKMALGSWSVERGVLL